MKLPALIETKRRKMERLKEFGKTLSAYIVVISILVGIGFALSYKYQVKPLKAEIEKQKSQIEELLKTQSR